ncbi:MAG: DNA/RNA non-specific endonuclease [Clostridia bacterium]|nr:DNA/RNA non-specific endonuclease [Clostridia bacterium]
MNKRLTAFLLSIILALSTLVGCFGGGDGGSGDGGSGDGGENSGPISLEIIPEYSGKAYVEINGNIPFFDEDEYVTESFERYTALDPLGRCGTAYACIGIDIMPTEDRESISSVKPSGWTYDGVSNNNKYDIVDGSYLFNRCHLIGYQLTGENANKQNLITGTRYLNIEGMLTFEDMVADYVKETENHVLYRVTPIFEGYNLVASGVLLEGFSVEDEGEGICFCVYSYNVQPGIDINYYNGRNRRNGETVDLGKTDGEHAGDTGAAAPDEDEGAPEFTYIMSKSTKTYHTSPNCSHAKKISEANLIEFIGTEREFLELYPDRTHCKTCKSQEESEQ